MRKIDLENSFSILANIGVLAGIVFLGFELQQNNELLAAQQRFNRLSLATGTTTLIAENPTLAQAMAKNGDPNSLTTVEQSQLEALAWRAILNQQWTFSELPRDEMPVEQWRYTARYAHWRNIWGQRKSQLDPEFVRFMEDNVLSAS